jgi:hypothetical protein
MYGEGLPVNRTDAYGGSGVVAALILNLATT